MLFNSPEFPVFFLLVFFVFSQLKGLKARQMLLLGSSLFFYGYWKAEYLILLVLASGIDFLAALQLQKSESPAVRKLWLWCSLASNIGILSFFKYGKFLAGIPEQFGLIRVVPDWLSVVLPVGISFYTFQAMAYVIDVYRQRIPAEHSYTRFLLFITFFPQLVAGPIERASHLLGQLNRLQTIAVEKILPALALIMMGFWKKLFLADRLGVYADEVFRDIQGSGGIQIAMATIFFGFQIYCDFSGYSDIARGIARFFGVELMVNFRRPYLSRSLGEFWRNWHISLSGWFRDYVYHPLGGNRTGKMRLMFNLLFVFGLSGIWHGASWTFLIWGLWHGCGLIAERLAGMDKSQNPWYAIPVMLWVFAGWMIFRAGSFEDLRRMCEGMLQAENLADIWQPMHSKTEFLIALAGIGGLMVLEIFRERAVSKFMLLRPERKALLLAGLTVLLVWLGKFKGSDFIYFQF
jgi:D-alanyl-lipoteichoic acid acyltransferase DltB (MBOAT superfamily)